LSWESFKERKKKALEEREEEEWSRRKKEAVFSAAEKYAEEFDLDPDELLRTFIAWDRLSKPHTARRGRRVYEGKGGEYWKRLKGVYGKEGLKFL